MSNIMESLILAQNERWRRVLSMQVERQPGQLSSQQGTDKRFTQRHEGTEEEKEEPRVLDFQTFVVSES